MTQPGIGGGGFMGLALEVILPPVQSALTTATTGGTITAGTYRYVVTAINAGGETTASNEQTITTTGSTSTVTVTWITVVGATGYKLYKTAAGGGAGTELLYKTVGAVTSDVDTSPGSPAGAFPLFNTASSYGTYTAPTKYFPFNTESLVFNQATVWRRPIRQSVDVLGGVAGNVHVAGDIEMECLEDVLVYFLAATRTTATRTAGPNFVYTFDPDPNATPNASLSLTVIRNGIVFGYTGCVVTQHTFTPSDGLLMFNVSILGSDEAVQSLPTPVYPTTTPFGAGQYLMNVAGSQVFDTDTFECMVNDNAEPQFRLKNTGRGAQFIKFGERECTMTAERDFLSRADYDAFKALTTQNNFMKAEKGTNNYVKFNMPNSIKNTYEVGLSGQGDLVRASIEYMNAINASGNSYTIEVATQEDAGQIL